MQDNGLEDQQSIKLLTFETCDQEYSLDIMCVREIRSWTKATPLPHAPCYILGVVNLRGAVLPVIDLAKRLGAKSRPYTNRNVIIVIRQRETVIGLLVDAVSDIISVEKEKLQIPPTVATGHDPVTVAALTHFDDRLIRILDPSSIIWQSNGRAA